MTEPDLATLPATRWRDDLDDPPASLIHPEAGIHLGTDRGGHPVTLPAPGPAGTRVAAIGESLFGRLIALRLLAVGARVTATTRVPEQWQGLREAAGDRLEFTDDPADWPRHLPAPLGVNPGPQALVTDRRRPPSATLAAGPWRTVVHVTRTAPRRASFWHRPDAVLVLDATYADQAGRLLGPDAAAHTAGLAPGEVALFGGAEARTLRPDISPAETALLTPGLRVRRADSMPLADQRRTAMTFGDLNGPTSHGETRSSGRA